MCLSIAEDESKQRPDRTRQAGISKREKSWKIVKKTRKTAILGRFGSFGEILDRAKNFDIFEKIISSERKVAVKAN